MLVAQIPPIQVFKPEWTYVQQRIACLICLVRDDGLMYPTGNVQFKQVGGIYLSIET